MTETTETTRLATLKAMLEARRIEVRDDVHSRMREGRKRQEVGRDALGGWLSRIINRSCERDNYDDLPSLGRPSEYPSDDFIGICIKTAAMAQQDSLRLP